MKKLLTGLFISGLMAHAYADPAKVYCSFKIMENETSGRKLKSLKQSQVFVTRHLNDGDSDSGVVQINKIVVEPGTDAAKDNSIFVFAKDDRIKNIKVEILPVPQSNPISWSYSKEDGKDTSIQIETSNNSIEIKLGGNTQQRTIATHRDSLLEIICAQEEGNVNTDEEKEKQLIKDYLKKKKADQAKKQ